MLTILIQASAIGNCTWGLEYWDGVVKVEVYKDL